MVVPHISGHSAHCLCGFGTYAQNKDCGRDVVKAIIDIGRRSYLLPRRSSGTLLAVVNLTTVSF